MNQPANNSGVGPYLTIDGVEEAISFYQAVFNGELLSKMMAEDGERVLHATMRIHGGTVMMSDEFPEYGGHPAPDMERGSPVAMSLRFKDPRNVDRVYALALENGGKESAKPEDMFWGDRFAQVIDIKGHRWMLVAPLEKPET